jgi:hypothetical protein
VCHHKAVEEAYILINGHTRAFLDGRRMLNEKADADFIAACSPDRIRALVEGKRRAEEEREQFRSSLATTCGKLAVADSQASFYRHQLDLIRMAHPEWTASDLRELARAALTPQEQKK